MFQSATSETKTADSRVNRPHVERDSGLHPFHATYGPTHGRGFRGSAGTTSPSGPHPLAALHRTVGNQALLRSLSSFQPTLQTKLTINTPGDQYEQEADRVAEHVTRMPDASSAPPSPVLQRGGSGPASTAAAPPIVHDVLGQAGQPLDASARAFFEPRFGRDFSHVRIHTGDRAAESAQAVQARAYTVGHAIVFNRGQDSFGSGDGLRLLAHELTHTVQQQSGTIQRRVLPDQDPDPSKAISEQLHQEPWTPPQPPQSDEEILRSLIDRAFAHERESLIGGSDWYGSMRQRVYQKESTDNVAEAKARHAGKAPELTGLGSNLRVDDFAAKMKSIQAGMSLSQLGLPFSNKIDTPKFDLLKEVEKAASSELAAVGIPEYLGSSAERLTEMAHLDPEHWKLVVNERMVAKTALSDDDTAALANSTLHESRHAEQWFLAARYVAMDPAKSAADVAEETGVEKDSVAPQAVAQRFDAKTDPAVAALGKTMLSAMQDQKNPDTSDRATAAIDELAVKRGRAQNALKDLNAHRSPETEAKAKAAADELQKQITIVEEQYHKYRQIPYEADAHQVGDAEGQAVRGWK